MKKTLAFITLTVILVCAMAFNAFALDFYFDDKATTAPEIDGSIAEDEYVWTTGELDKAVTFYNEFYVVEPHTDAVYLSLQYYMSFDDNYIYIALAERTTGYETSQLIDLTFCTAAGEIKGDMALCFDFVRNNDLGEGYEPTYNYLTIDGEDATGDIATYVADAKGYYFDDGMRNNNYVEIALDRAAIEELVGEEIVGFGFRFTNQPDAEYGQVVYGDEESIAFPAELNTDIGYHFIGFEEDALDNLGAEETPIETDPVDTDPVETDPTETEPTETQPTETEPTETEPTETEPTETEPVSEGGCGASLAVACVAMIATLGTCLVFVTKK